MTRSPADNQQTVEAALTWAGNADETELRENARAALRDLATQASQGEDWKQLATEMGEALRKTQRFCGGCVDADALLARLDGLAAGEEGA